MATIIEIKTGNRLENVADGKAATLVQSGRYYYEGEKVEVSPDLATELLEAEKQALIEEREELEAQKSDVTIKRENLQIDIAAFETEKQKHVEDKAVLEAEKQALADEKAAFETEKQTFATNKQNNKK